MLDGVHGDLQGDGNKFFHLLGASARPLGNDGDLGIGDVRKGLYRHVMKSDDTPGGQSRSSKKDKILVLEGKREDSLERFIHGKIVGVERVKQKGLNRNIEFIQYLAAKQIIRAADPDFIKSLDNTFC